MLKTANFLRRRRGTQLRPNERDALEQLLSSPRAVPPRQTIARIGEPLDHSTLLISGFIGRYMADRDGDRQLVALHLAGDFVDLHAFPLKHLDHDVVTLTDATIATIGHAALAKITADLPNLSRLLWFSTLLDAAMHREWIFRLGRLDGPGRLAHFLCETAVRMEAVGLSDGYAFTLPLTQSDIAEACGLTNVHVSRVLSSLRAKGLVAVDGFAFVLTDVPALRSLGEFNPQYLYFEESEPT